MATTPWNGFRSVLCPVDFSDQSGLALRYAEAVALRTDAQLRGLYTNDPLLVAAAATSLNDRTLAARSAQELQQFVKATLAGESFKQLRLSSDVAIGHPANEILKTAARGRSDLIVMGTYGLTGPGRWIIGSTTLSVLQRSRIPVLAVPRLNGGATLAGWPDRQLVAAVEFDAPSANEVDVSARVARAFGATLLLLHVVDEIAAPAWLSGNLSAHQRIRVARAQKDLDALAARARRHTETASRVVCGRVADEIAAFAADRRTGLLLTALRDRRGWFGAKRGSVSYHVLAHAVTPVLAYPSEWRPR
jgi:nucleotide-binding universal stress UspA family protein